VEKNGVSFRTRTGANISVWWKGGVEKNRVLFAHVPEPIYIIVMVEGRGGKEQCSFRTRTGANSFDQIEGRGGKEQCSFRTRTEANILF
jgi:hypothetical protein